MGLFGFGKKKKKEAAKKASASQKKKAPAKSSSKSSSKPSGKSSSASKTTKKPTIKEEKRILKSTTLRLRVGTCGNVIQVSRCNISSVNNLLTISNILVDQYNCYYDIEGRPINIDISNRVLRITYCSEPTPFDNQGRGMGSRKLHKIDVEDTIEVPDGLVINTNVGDVYLSAIDGDELHYHVIGTIGGDMETEESYIDEKGQLVLDYKVEDGLFGDDEKLEIYVELPKYMYNLLAVTTTTGDIDATEISGAYFIDYRVSTSSGDIALANDCVFNDGNDITFGTAVFKSSSGDMELKISIVDNNDNHYLINKLNVKSSSGDVDIAIPSLVTNINTSSGDVTYGGCYAKDININTSSGDVEISPAFFSEGDVSITTSSGDIEVTGYGVGYWDYDGEEDVDDLNTDGEQTVHLSIITNSGDIDFE